MPEPQEIPEKVESSLTPPEILQDIAHHAIQFASVCQEIAKKDDIDPVWLQIKQEQLKDHHMWLIVLASLLMPEEQKED